MLNDNNTQVFDLNSSKGIGQAGIMLHKLASEEAQRERDRDERCKAQTEHILARLDST